MTLPLTPLKTRHQCRSQRKRQNVDKDDQTKANYTNDDGDENEHAVALVNALVGADGTETKSSL